MSASNQEIQDALADKKPDLLADAHQILSTLGYKSQRTVDGIHQPSEFLQQYDPKNGEGVNADELKEHADKIGIVFQVTDEEIREANEPAASEFQRNNKRSFFFVAADLKAGHYPRGQLARMTRAVNRCFASPTVVLFRHPDSDAGDAISLSFISRRRSKIDDTKDVLGRVSILRAIRRDDPHRGHLKILQDLTLPAQLQWIKDQSKNLDFDGLLAAWLNTLDTETLNKHFYKALFEWFERAVQQCKFPDSETAGKNEEQVIRMITRMLFIWFIKEKGLVPKELFEESFALDILKKHQPDNSDYYRAVLQNLFFGTLNTPQEDRDFRQRDEHGKGKSDQYRVFNLYRYEDMLKNPQDFVKRLHPVPFVNGGLFDCLDGFETGGHQPDRRRIDCFTDNGTHRKLLKVPSHLFFDEDKGLFPLFNQFKFTVAENTPLDQEVALDPELLGMVFENLLAAIVPESHENARKQTGSFYTPRPIVEYMVDEALIAYLSGKLEEEAVPKLQQLLSWEDAEGDNEPLASKEKDGIINAIDELRILDPAVGSGAFPMGILHKLVHILSQVDPQNAQWAKMQRERAATITDPTVRKNTMEDIEKIFSGSNNFGDYGRKLYLIQRTIHGADLQAVAAQITRLRFFISLIIDQKPNDDQPNRGIEPLPNLETKFVAANTLIGLEKNRQKEGQRDITEIDEVQKLQSQIEGIRTEYFGAKNRKHKHDLRDRDEKLREELSKILEDMGFPKGDAERFAKWKPYEQTFQANWFDAELMMGIPDGFDIVIGNPPYVKAEHMDDQQKRSLKNLYGWVDDLYAHFIFCGHALIRKGGLLTYIANDSFIGLKSKERIRRLFLQNDLQSITRCPGNTFGATIYTAIFLLKNKESEIAGYKTGELYEPDYEYRDWGAISYETTEKLPYARLSIRSPILELVGHLLTDFPSFRKSFLVLDAGIHSGNVRERIFFANKEQENLSRLLQGRQMERWRICWDTPAAQYKWCDPDYQPQARSGIGRKGKPSAKNEYWHFCDNRENHHLPERLLLRQTSDKLVAAYHSEAEDGQFYTDNTLFTIRHSGRSIPPLQYALALLNSKLMNRIYEFLAQEGGKILPQVKTGLVEKLPLAIGTDTEISTVSDLADKITAVKRENSDADTSKYEAEIDRCIYALYRLTPEDIALVEGDS